MPEIRFLLVLGGWVWQSNFKWNSIIYNVQFQVIDSMLFGQVRVAFLGTVKIYFGQRWHSRLEKLASVLICC